MPDAEECPEVILNRLRGNMTWAGQWMRTDYVVAGKKLAQTSFKG